MFFVVPVVFFFFSSPHGKLSLASRRYRLTHTSAALGWHPEWAASPCFCWVLFFMSRDVDACCPCSELCYSQAHGTAQKVVMEMHDQTMVTAVWSRSYCIRCFSAAFIWALEWAALRAHRMGIAGGSGWVKLLWMWLIAMRPLPLSPSSTPQWIHITYSALDQQVINSNKARFLSGRKKIPLIIVHDYSKPNVQIVVGNDA